MQISTIRILSVLIGVFAGLAFNFFGFILIYFTFGSDSVGDVGQSIQRVIEDGVVFSAPIFPLIGAVLGYSVAAIVIRSRRM